MELYGRRDLLESLAASAAPVTLLVGDSGTGKSATLEQSQATSTAVAPPPVQVGQAPGSLQVALLESLAGAVALLTSDLTTAQRIGELLRAAAGKVKEMRLKDLRGAVGNHLLSLVRSRVGDDLADLLSDCGTAISSSAGESLSTRITSASDQDVIDQIVSFATEVKEMAGDREILLALDDVDRLNDDDLRRFADLSARLPPGIRIHASFTTWHATSRERSESLQLGGAEIVSIAGLAETDIEGWLLAESLDVELVVSVMAATNGYPVHVSDAIALLLRNPFPHTLRLMTPAQVLLVRTRQAWRELDLACQIVAAKLCFYQDPLPTERVCDLLGLDEITWGTFAMRLIDSGLLLDDRRRWFHELRRRVIWSDLITGEMRRAAIEAAGAEIAGQLALPSAGPRDYIDFARVANENPDLRTSEPGLAEALNATLDEVAIAAAALELIEYSHGHQAIDAEVLLAHARDRYPAIDDPVAALSRLQAHGLVHVVSDNRSAVAAPTWGSVATVQVIRGRAAEELGWFPVTQLASAVFESIIRPRLGSFGRVMYGVGAFSIAKASEEVSALHRVPRDGVVHVGFEEPGVVVRGSHGTTPLYAAISFRDTVASRAAVGRLDGLTQKLWGVDLDLHDVVHLPTQVVPSLRFARALEWLDGRPNFSLHMLRPVDGERHMSLQEELSACLVLRSVIRERSDTNERFAYEIEQPKGYRFSQSGDSQVILEISNSEDVEELDALGTVDFNQPFARLKLAQDLALPRGQVFRRTTWRIGTSRQDPVTQTVVELCQSAEKFNTKQTPIRVEFDEGKLRALLKSAFERREADGRAILEALPNMGLSLPTPTTTAVVLELDEPSEGWVPGAHARLISAVVPKRGAEDLLFKLYLPNERTPTDPSNPRPEVIRDAFGIDPNSALWHAEGDAIMGLSEMLGYGQSEVRFRYSDSEIGKD